MMHHDSICHLCFILQKESIECELCKAIIQEIDEVLEKNATFKKINDTVYGICNRLPKEYKDIVKAVSYSTIYHKKWDLTGW